MKTSIASGYSGTRGPLAMAYRLATVCLLLGLGLIGGRAAVAQTVVAPPSATPPSSTAPTATSRAVTPGVREAASGVSSGAPATPLDSSPLRSDPRSVNTAVEQAARLSREGQPQAALAGLEEALKLHPRDPQLRFLYGVLMAELKRTDDAINVFELLTQDFPELPEPHNNLAVMLAGRGDLDRARHALENAVRALPGYALAQENLGDVYLRMAARAYERAGQLDPRSASSRDKLALAREMLARAAPGTSKSTNTTPR